MNNNNNQTIKATINQKWERRDKNDDDYLILKLDNGRNVLVFSGKIGKERWAWLEESKEYNFTVEEGKNDNYLLVDFEVEINS